MTKVELPSDAPSEFGGGKLLLRVVCGSVAYGLATDESDVDTRGVYIPGARELFGWEPKEQHESPGKDHVVYSLRKFLRLAAAGNPNIIETLFTPEEHVLHLDDEFGKPLIEARQSLLSKRVSERFSRYASHQLKRLESHRRFVRDAPPKEPDPIDFGARHGDGRVIWEDPAAHKRFDTATDRFVAFERWRKKRNPKRAALELEHGFDTKHAMHLCRLLAMGEEILERGEVLVRRPDREWLLGIKRGDVPFDELKTFAQEKQRRLESLASTSPLPDTPDDAALETLLIELTSRFVLKQLNA